MPFSEIAAAMNRKANINTAHKATLIEANRYFALTYSFLVIGVINV